MRMRGWYLFFVALFVTTNAGKEKIQKDLLAKLEASPDGRWNILLEFEKLPNSVVAKLSPLETRKKLMEHAGKTQAEVRKKLQNFKSLWIVNVISVLNANKAQIDSLADESSITQIVEDIKLEMLPTEMKVISQSAPSARQAGQVDPKAWGVIKIDAPKWRSAGYDGTGIIVGHIDTGADLNHPELKDSWLGKEGGWLNVADNDSKVPSDNEPTSHGTGTLGVMVGKSIGVAPGVKWISCGFCRPDGKPDIRPATLIACGEFMLCPNPDGECSSKPHLVTNGWGVDHRNPYGIHFFDEMILKLRDKGIIPLFPAGNEGDRYGCRDSLAVPGDHEKVYSVGMTDERDVLSYMSGQGPPTEARYKDEELISRRIIKPDLVAPGVEVYTAVKGGTYGLKTGTSFAVPHVGGAIALLLSRNDNMSYKEIYDILINSTVHHVNTTDPQKPCFNMDDAAIPNYKLGWGRLQLPDPNASWLPPLHRPNPINGGMATFCINLNFCLAALMIRALLLIRLDLD